MAVRKLAYSIDEAAQMSGLTTSYLYKLIYEGFFKPGEYSAFASVPKDTAGEKKKKTAPRTHYTINRLGMKRLTGLNPDITDYLDELAARMVDIQEKRAKARRSA